MMKNLLHTIGILLVATIIIGTLSQCGSSSKVTKPRRIHRGLNPEDQKPGACYARCLIQDVWAIEHDTVYVYTGDRADDLDAVQNVTKDIQVARRVWKKVPQKKEDCIGYDPSLCWTWCLVEIPGETMVLPIVSDTAQVKEYEQRVIKREVLVSEGGYTDWVEVICEPKITTTFIKDLQKRLKKEGYLKKYTKGEMDQASKDALLAFQRATGQRLGQLDLDTLDALGVVY